jgi:hypothetical protein
LISDPAQNMPPGTPGCTTDEDHDGVADQYDNCIGVANPDQSDINNNGIGDACDVDMDGDGIMDKNPDLSARTVANGGDNCPKNFNPDQADSTNSGVGDACNPTFCYVVDKNNPDACLDPNGVFAVSAGPAVTGATGTAITLPLFANRNGVGINYTWTVTSRPSGSTAAITSAEGTSSLSRNWEYAYTNGNVPTFTPDVAGSYTFQLQATLAFPDKVYPQNNSAVAQVTSSFKGGSTTNPSKGGCTSGSGELSLLALLGVSSLLARRKRS